MVQWPSATLYNGLQTVADHQGERTALRFNDEQFSYTGLLRESRALAHGFSDLGIGEGDPIAVWLANRPEWIKVQLAASYLGAPIVAANTRYRTHELEYMLSDAECVALVTEESFLDNDYFGMLSELMPSIQVDDPRSFSPKAFPALEHVIAIDDDENISAIRQYDDIESAGRNRHELHPADNPLAPACIFYTSGTTSDPKGCSQSNRSLLNHSYAIGEHLGLTKDGVMLGVLPYCGVLGYNALMSALTHGQSVVVQTHFDPVNVVQAIDNHDVTFTNMIATMWRRTLDSDAFSEECVSTLRRGVVTFMNGFNASEFDRFEESFGLPLVQPYGLSEANSQVFIGRPEDNRDQRKKVGGPLVDPDGEAAKIVDLESGSDLPDGEEGELCLRGYNVMTEYLNKPEKTAEAIDEDEWLHTGDIGYRDEQGYFYYHSRLGDAVRIRGFLVTPQEIEEVIQEVEGVDLTAVVGVRHPDNGQVLVAFVQRSDDSVDDRAIRTYLEGQVADYKEPYIVKFVEKFPRAEGPHGEKIQKPKLRERAEQLVKTG